MTKTQGEVTKAAKRLTLLCLARLYQVGQLTTFGIISEYRLEAENSVR